MDLYVSSSSIEEPADLERVLKSYKESGIENVELGSSHQYKPNLVEMVKNYSASFNYVIHNYFPPHKESFALNLSSSNDEIYNKSIQHAVNAIEICADLNIPIYSMHAGMLRDPVNIQFFEGFTFDQQTIETDYNLAFNKLVEACREINKYAYSKGVKFAIENSGGHPSKFKNLMMTRISEFKKLLFQVDHENFGVLLDIGHYNISESLYPYENLNRFIKEFKSKIFQVHVSHNDGTDDQHLSPTSKEIRSVQTILEVNPNAIITLESMNVSIEEILSSWKYMKMGMIYDE